MSDPAYDGLCGIPSTARLRGGTYLRCKYEFGHAGDHSWVHIEPKVRLSSVCNRPLQADEGSKKT